MLYDLLEDPSRTIAQLAFVVASALSGLALGALVIPVVTFIG